MYGIAYSYIKFTDRTNCKVAWCIVPFARKTTTQIHAGLFSPRVIRLSWHKVGVCHWIHYLTACVWWCHSPDELRSTSGICALSSCPEEVPPSGDVFKASDQCWIWKYSRKPIGLMWIRLQCLVQHSVILLYTQDLVTGSGVHRVWLGGLSPPNSEISPSKIMSRSPPKSYNGAASCSAGVANVHSLWFC